MPVTWCDFLQIKRLYPAQFDLNLRFTRQNDQFLLLSAVDNYRIKVHEMKLHVKYMDVHPSVLQDHRAKIGRNLPIIFPMHKTTVLTKEFPVGSTGINWPNVFTGNLPKQVIFGMVESASFLGKTDKNPYR